MVEAETRGPHEQRQNRHRGPKCDSFHAKLPCRKRTAPRRSPPPPRQATAVSAGGRHPPRSPLYFAVREKQVEVATFLLDHGADPFGLALNDSLLEIARDRGYVEMEKLLEAKYASLYGASPKGEALAAAIREHDLAKVKDL